MTPEAAEAEATFIQSLVDNDVFRAGEPVIGEVTVEVNGDYAVAQACVDASRWLLGSSRGLPVQQVLEAGNQPHAVAVRQQDDGSWLVDQIPYEDEEEATITC